jgi:putative ABC transport system ATP-binding protein
VSAATRVAGGAGAVVVDSVTHGLRAPGVPIISEVSVVVAAGELVVVEGRSGSGKSTLCQLVAGLEPPDRGEVTVGGMPAAGIQDWSRLAALPQRLGLAEELTVAENLHLPAWLHGVAERSDLLDALDLSHLADRLVGQTSRGEQQRVAFARAASLRPAALVLDEPTSHQDEGRAELVVDRVRAVAAEGTAVLVATHDPRLVEVADRVVHLDAGVHRPR